MNMINEVKVIADRLDGKSYDNMGFSIERIEREILPGGVEAENFALSVIPYSKNGSGLTDELKLTCCTEIAERLRSSYFTAAVQYEVLFFCKSTEGEIALKIRPIYLKKENEEDEEDEKNCTE